MFKFLHAADIHLDSPLRGLPRHEDAPIDEIRQSTRRALENLVRLAIDEQVAFLLIAGDLYDGDHNDYNTVRFFVRQMSELNRAGIRVFLIAGNHDAANKMTKVLQLPENVRMLDHKRPETVRLENPGVAIHGQSYAQRATLERIARDYPPAEPGLFNIGLLHTSATGREGHEPYAPCSLDDLQSKQYDYWALGHVHRREVLVDDPPIIFSGNLQGRHVRETGPKGCTLVTVDDANRPHPEPRYVDVFRWENCRLDASEITSGQELLDQIRQTLVERMADADGRPLAARIEVTGPSSIHRELAAEPNRWEHEIRALAHDVDVDRLWIEKVKLRTSSPAELDRFQMADGPMASLLEYLDELRSAPEQLTALAADEFGPFRDRLPRELTEGPEAIAPDSPEVLRDTLDQVEEMLIRRLLTEEGRP